MKAQQLFLCMSLLFPVLGVQASTDINPIEENALDNIFFPYVMAFTYDNAGNTTRIACSIHYNRLNKQETEDERSQSRIEDFEVSINADDSWEKVTINVTGCCENPILNIYNLAGIKCFSEEMDGISMTANLSSLKKGVYLFLFSADGYTKTYKLIKRR